MMSGYEEVLAELTGKRQKATHIADKAKLPVQQVAGILTQMVKDDIVTFEKTDTEAYLRFTLKHA